MGQITILDTGFLNISGTGTQASVIANSGSVITLKTGKLSFQRKSNTDSTEIINTTTGPVVGFGTVTAGLWVVNGVLDSNVAADMDLIKPLNDLLSTFGVKLLYYSDTTDGFRDLTESLGDPNKNDAHKSANFGGTTTPHLHVKVNNFQIPQMSSSKHLRYTLEMMETT